MRFWLLVLLVLAAPAGAEEKPVDKLKDVQAQLSAQQDKVDELEATAGQLGREVKSLRAQLVKAVRDQDKVAAEVEATEARVEALSKEVDARTAEMNQRRGELAETLGLMQRVAQTPPAALALETQEPRDLALAQDQLAALVPVLNERVARLAATVKELQVLRGSFAEEKARLAARQDKLAKEQARLKKLVALRQGRLKDTQTQTATEARAAKRLAAEAADLEALVGKLEKRQRVTPEADEAVVDAAPRPSALPANMAGRLPASGLALVRFGEKDRLGNPSRGLTISTRPNAAVVTVAAGKVAFSGPFRGYGRVVIVEHPGQWHSVIAGLTELSVQAGQTLGAGEPVGSMGSSERGRELYFEIRHNGRSVDPLGAVAARLTMTQNR